MVKKIKETNKINKTLSNGVSGDSDDELYDYFTSDRTDQFENDIIKSRRLFLNAKVIIFFNFLLFS